jgi:hypothetical protein
MISYLVTYSQKFLNQYYYTPELYSTYTVLTFIQPV